MIDKVLGQKVAAPSQYDKSILVREERQTNRKHIGIEDSNLPFSEQSIDCWSCWEISCLTDTGLPVTGIARIVYPASSKYIVESKSIKLYFNSFNMTKMGASPDTAIYNLRALAVKDLSELLETEVKVGIFSASEKLQYTDWLNEYEDWECIDNVDQVGPFEYKENPALLKEEENLDGLIVAQAFFTTVLRSNCRITFQPDHGTAYIYIKGYKPVDKKSLLKYLVSFREHQEFHENCVERIYKRLWDKFKPEELFVYCPYVRRGSLDINPIRVSHVDLLPNELVVVNIPYTKTSRQ